MQSLIITEPNEKFIILIMELLKNNTDYADTLLTVVAGEILKK